MTTYLLYIHDDRYATPNLEVISAVDDTGAEALAADRLRASDHYFRTEVWEDDRLVCDLPL